MNRLVKNGSIVLDGTAPKYEKIMQICKKIEAIEDWEEKTNVSAIDFLNRFLEGGMWAYHKQANFIGKVGFDIKEAMDCKTIKVERIIK